MKDKVVIVTGASSGIGKSIAIEMLGMNAKVVLAARNEEKLNEIAEPFQSSGKSILVVKTDVRIESDCQSLIEETIKHYGKIDVLINNAGISMRANFQETDLKVLKELMDTNFWGTVYCTKYALTHILNTKGSIVGVSSIAGYKGLPGRIGYSASKFAIQGFLEVLRTENMKKGLHVLIACPNFTASNIRNAALTKDGTAQGDSPMTEEKLTSAEKVAKRICKAIIKRKNRLIITFEGNLIVFLHRIMPRVLDRIVYNRMAKEPDSPLK
ncbi:MAG: SDR family oxidoreductase [Bacteroidetes bacterium]|nr:SDR family oxidoreductase [Bacteroidota bacterium]